MMAKPCVVIPYVFMPGKHGAGAEEDDGNEYAIQEAIPVSIS